MGQVTSVAALQSWIGMLFTYLRFWQGTRYAENNEQDPDPEGTREALARIKRHRHPGQPFVRIQDLQ
jgi:amino acid transporter